MNINSYANHPGSMNPMGLQNMHGMQSMQPGMGMQGTSGKFIDLVVTRYKLIVFI